MSSSADNDVRARLGTYLFDNWTGWDEARCAGHGGAVTMVEHLPENQSPCLFGEPTEDGMIRWKPVPMTETPDFSAVETALAEIDTTLHPDVVSLYGSYWSFELPGDEHSGEPVSLYTVWNERSLRGTIEVLAEGVRRQILDGFRDSTFPVACTGSDLGFVLENGTGRILLQEPGYPADRVVAPSLAQFLAEL
jgi:hypothetical protein